MLVSFLNLQNFHPKNCETSDFYGTLKTPKNLKLITYHLQSDL